MVMRGTEEGSPPGLRPHLRLKLRREWSYRPEERRLVSEGGDELEPGKELPEGSEIVPVAPSLARRAKSSLSADERELARWLQLILPEGADLEGARAVAERWEGVERVEAAPDVKLPSGGDAPPSPDSPMDPGPH